MNDTQSPVNTAHQQPAPQATPSKPHWEVYVAVATILLSLVGNLLQFKDLQNKSQEIVQKGTEIQLKDRELSQKDQDLRLKDDELKQRRAELESIRSAERLRCESVQAQVSSLNGRIAQNNANFKKARSDLTFGSKGGPSQADYKEYEATVARLQSLREKLAEERRELLRIVGESKCPVDVDQLPRGWKPT